MLRYAWQNAGYDTGEPVDNFTGLTEVAFSIDIIECAVMTCLNIVLAKYDEILQPNYYLSVLKKFENFYTQT